jgi:hypothetical protein
MTYHINAARFSSNAYRRAREFGRGRLFSAWLQVRFWLTGRTGKYRIRWGNATQRAPICADTGAPKWPGNCWNVRCQLGGTCCRAHGVEVPAPTEQKGGA